MATNLENLKLRKDQIKSKYARDIEQINRQIQAAEDEESATNYARAPNPFCKTQ